MKELEAPPSMPLSEELLFPSPSESKKSKSKTSKRLPDWKVLRDHFNKEGRVSREHCH